MLWLKKSNYDDADSLRSVIKITYKMHAPHNTYNLLGLDKLNYPCFDDTSFSYVFDHYLRT